MNDRWPDLRALLQACNRAWDRWIESGRRMTGPIYRELHDLEQEVMQVIQDNDANLIIYGSTVYMIQGNKLSIYEGLTVEMITRKGPDQ